ncbi:MAG: DUF2934 domain-containing protein [Methylococcaceae bacterium]|nr:DUF2934 domain-containing protein [Methylococcaceae bacterium]
MLNSNPSFFDDWAWLPGWLALTDRDVVSLVVLGVFAALLAWEVRGGYGRQPSRILRHSYLTNLGILIVNDVTLSLLAVGSLWTVADRYSDLGLLSGIENPVLKGVLALLLLDLGLYAWHWACHRVEGLWRFHRVHHSDLAMNVSTAFRLHLVELLLTTLLKAAMVVVLGIDALLLLVCETLLTLLVMFHHANVRFAAEGMLARVFIVPALHRVHHSQLRHEHDSNYGAAFSLWDRLFGTLLELEPAALGLKNVGEQSVWETIRYGFASLKPQAPVPVHAMIAEAAYYRAERRGFRPGSELSDWVEAEREILGRRWLSQQAVARPLRCPKPEYCSLPR